MEKVQKIWTGLEELIVVVTFGLILLLTFANVVTRFFFPSISLAITEEFSLYIYMWTVIFGASVCFKRGAHLGLPLVYERIPRKGKLAFTLISTGCCLAALGIMTRETWAMSLNQIRNHIVSPATQIPAWIGSIALPIGGIFNIARVIEGCVHTVKKLRRTEEERKGGGA